MNTAARTTLQSGDCLWLSTENEPLPHLHELAVEDGHVARIVVDQRETDLYVVVTGPDAVRTRYDERDRGPEFITICAGSSCVYSIEIGGVQGSAGSIGYTLSVDVTRKKTPDDDMRMKAEFASTEGKRLTAIRNAESYSRALDQYSHALELWRLLGETMAEGTTLIGIGDIHYFQSRLDRAAERFAEARSVFHRMGDRRGVAEALNGQGAALWQLARIDEAMAAFNEALENWRALGHTGGEAATLSNLGILSYEVGEWQQALDHFLSARRLARSLKNSLGEAYACNNLAVAHNALGQHRSALTYLNLALRLFRRCQNGPAAARALLLLGQIHLFLEDFESAERYGREAWPEIAASGDHRSIADTLRHLAQVAERIGNLDEAFANYRDALKIYREIGNPQGEGAALHGLGTVCFQRGDDAEALRLLAQARRVRKNIGATDGEADTLFVIARLAERRGRLRTALQHIQAAIAIAEQLRTRIAGSDFRTSYFSSKHDYHGFHIQLLMRFNDERPGEGYDGLAFEASERGRARGLLDLLDLTCGLQPVNVDPELLEQVRQLERRIRYWSHRRARALASGNEEEGTQARQQLTPLMDAYPELDSRIRAASTEAAGEPALPQPLSLDQAQQELIDDDTTLLQYALGDRRCYLWAVDSTTIHSFDLGPKDAIVAAARRLYDLVSTSGKRSRKPETISSWDEAARVVSKFLLPRHTIREGTKRLIFASDGILQYIPFAALTDPLGTLPLVERYEVVCIPSISALASLRRVISVREKAPLEIVLIADPVFDIRDPRVGSTQSGQQPESGRRHVRGAGRLSRLLFSRREAEHILKWIPPGRGSFAMDFDASEALINSDFLRAYRIIHFASHALIDHQSPDLSSLVVSLVRPDATPQDGLIPVRRISQLRLLADLVVLSACKTGLGKDVRGEGIVGLTRGFMYAGAARLLVSLWKVDDEGTSELMRHFYEALLGPRKLSPAAALRAAQLEMLAEKRWQSPYYWAGFVLQGEWRQEIARP